MVLMGNFTYFMRSYHFHMCSRIVIFVSPARRGCDQKAHLRQHSSAPQPVFRELISIGCVFVIRFATKIFHFPIVHHQKTVLRMPPVTFSMCPCCLLCCIISLSARLRPTPFLISIVLKMTQIFPIAGWRWGTDRGRGWRSSERVCSARLRPATCHILHTNG